MSAKQQNVPKLRFSEFSEAWKKSKAGDAFKNSRAKGRAGIPIYSVTLDRGLVRRDTMERQMAAGAVDSDNLCAQKGDIVYNMMRMWQGAVGVAPEECMISPAYVVLSPKKQTSSLFFDYWFKSSKMLHKLWAYSHGITSDRLRLYFDDFAQIPVHLAPLPEQEKIAAFLGAVEAKLLALRQSQKLLQDYKKGLMQKLFSQALRFKRDDGTAFPDWEERALDEILIVTKGQQLNRDTLEDFGSYPVINGGMSPSGFTDVYNTEACTITISEGGNSCGFVGFQKTRFWSGGHCYTVMARDKGWNISFQFQLLKFYEPSIMRLRVGSGLPNIQKGDLLKLQLQSPSHPDEQHKIADLLSAVDAKIAAVSAQIDKMTLFKKGLLQQMFV